MGKMQVGENFQDMVTSAVHTVEEKLGCEYFAIYLTGSRAYGYAENRETSDYDFVVYVYPRVSDLLTNKMVSKEVVVSEELVDKVKVKDFRLLRKELLKPAFGTLYLLNNPVRVKYGKNQSQLQKVLNSEDNAFVKDCFNMGLRNLLFSLSGATSGFLFTYGSKYGYPKENSRLFYLKLMFDRFKKQDFDLFWEDGEEYRNSLQSCLFKLGDPEFANLEQDMFQEAKKTPSLELDTTVLDNLLFKEFKRGVLNNLMY